jgi:hypothetical protein
MAIQPDTKDWTWVLVRPCPECGFDTRSLSGPEVPGLIRNVSDAWGQVLGGGDPDASGRPGIGARLSPHRWSPLEYGCHVRDVLRLGDARLQLMLIQADPAFPNWDQDRTASDANYAGQDPASVATGIAAAAERFADDLERLAPDGWSRRGHRSDGATFSVEAFARYVAHDPVHHLADVGAPLR